MKAKEMAQLFARVSPEVKVRVGQEADKNRRSITAELGLLIEDGFKWRDQQSKQASA